MPVVQAIVLGVVQGLSEFLPISSSAHLILVPWLFGWQDPGLAFDVALHWGTLVAVLAVFWRDWIRLIRAAALSILDRRIGEDPDRRLFWALFVSSIPAAIAGKLLNEWAEETLRQPLLIIGTGQDNHRLRALAGPTVRFLGWQPDPVVRDHLRRCRALLFPGEEDFGIVPVEAQACGAPVIAFVILRKFCRLGPADAAGVAAHYGSVSAVTFIAAQSFVAAQGAPAGAVAYRTTGT